MMTDVNFQTRAVNAKHYERIRAAREAVSSATGMLILTLLKAYPVGAQVLLREPRARKATLYTVHEHTVIPSRWVTMRNVKTGSKRAIDITTASVELVEHVYEDYHFTSGDSDPLGHFGPDDRRRVVAAPEGR